MIFASILPEAKKHPFQTELSCINENNRSRSLCVSFLESVSPGSTEKSKSIGTQKAPATTGQAQAPRHASSIPII